MDRFVDAVSDGEMRGFDEPAEKIENVIRGGEIMRAIGAKLLRTTAMASCVTAGLLFLPAAASAQAAQAASAAQESSNGQLEEIIVTAQKREQNAQDVPISISTLSEETLARNQFSDFRALGTIAPSVNFQGGYAPSATNFNIRGVGSYAFTGGIQPSVSLVVDGVPYARAGEFITDLGDIERIEVLRGPQGTLFGRNSTGGAINVTRKRPTREFEGELEGGISTDEEYVVRGVLSGPLSDSVRARVAGVYLNRDGHIKNFGPPSGGGNLDGEETYALSGKLDIDLTPAFNVLFSGDYSNRTDGYSAQLASPLADLCRGCGPGGIDIDIAGGARAAALGGGDPVAGRQILNNPFSAAVSSRGDDNKNRAFGGSIDATWHLSDALKLKSITAYREFTDYNNPDVDGTPADGDNLVTPIVSVTLSQGQTILQNGGRYTQARKVNSDYVIQELRLEGTFSAFDVTAGGFYQNFHEHLLNTTPLLILDAFVPGIGNGAVLGGTATAGDEYVLSANTQNNSYSIETFAAFGDVTFHLTDQLDIFGGLRYTKEDVSKNVNNGSFFALFSRAQIATRFNSTTRILNIDDLTANPLSVGRASTKADFVSYRLGASYKITHAISFYGTVSRGQVGPGAPISYTDGLGFLAPTTADNYEVGFKSELFDRRVRFNLAAYKINVKNLQASALIPGTVNTATLNAGNLNIKGFEADLTAAVSRMLTLGGSLVYVDSKIEKLLQPCFFDQRTSNTVPGCTIDANGDGTPDTQDVSGRPGTNTPKWSFNTYASLNIPTQGLPFDFYGLVNYSYKSRTQFTLNQDDLASQKGYGLLDLTLGLKAKNGSYEVFVYGKNILDKFYVSDAFEAVPALGRQVIRTPRNGHDYFGAGVKFHF